MWQLDHKEGWAPKNLYFLTVVFREDSWEDEMVGWHHQFNRHEFEQTPREVKDREAWWAVVHGVIKSKMWLCDWTVTNFNSLFGIIWNLNFGRGQKYVFFQEFTLRKTKASCTWWKLIFQESLISLGQGRIFASSYSLFSTEARAMVWEFGVWFPFQIREELSERRSPTGQWRLTNKTNQLASCPWVSLLAGARNVCEQENISAWDQERTLICHSTAPLGDRVASTQLGGSCPWRGWLLTSQLEMGPETLLLICCYVSNLKKTGKVSSSATAKEETNCLPSPSRSAQRYSLSPEYSHLLPET